MPEEADANTVRKVLWDVAIENSKDVAKTVADHIAGKCCVDRSVREQWATMDARTKKEETFTGGDLLEVMSPGDVISLHADELIEYIENGGSGKFKFVCDKEIVERLKKLPDKTGIKIHLREDNKFALKFPHPINLDSPCS